MRSYKFTYDHIQKKIGKGFTRGYNQMDGSVDTWANKALTRWRSEGWAKRIERWMDVHLDGRMDRWMKRWIHDGIDVKG